ncbi:protease complex subunit PrcB family protein [Thermoflavimicrobium daqui]|uniref:PrcB C-terminal domain-containing protein n=1 Tax=Thermoflavimicrobium daqui TaxID=2137476 RepID=A0A364K5V8_9BACL|nr:protease complex subunit PrcB family protein [Thermoflavimicrobium daqui]RAL25686.1 hypothetical protein DL897_06310 [Thermoflavimicrobium daqui]
MRKFFISFLSLSLLLFGCSLNPSDQDSITQKEEGKKEKMETKQLVVQQVKKENAPPEIQKQVEQMMKQGGTHSLSSNNQIYVIIALGKRKSGGYRIQISKAEKKGDEATIYAEEIPPSPTDFVTQAITYPIEIFTIPKENIKKINIRIK